MRVPNAHIRFLFVLLMIFVGLTCHAQIQRQFFGLELGNTTKSSTIKTLESKGYHVESLSNGGLMIANVDFGGRAWSGVGFTFYKGTLAEVKFIKMKKNTNLKLYYEYLLENLITKYSDYFFAELSSQGDVFFADSNTALAVVYSHNPESVTLLYQDNREVKDFIREDSKDL